MGPNYMDDLYPQFSSKPRMPKFLVWAVLLAVIVITLIGLSMAQAATASYYTVASCLREGTSGIMANGARLDDRALTAAMWGVKFGTKVRVTNLKNGKEVVVKITDRGPAKRLYRKGRIIDLSRAAFAAIADLRTGVISVDVEVLND